MPDETAVTEATGRGDSANEVDAAAYERDAIQLARADPSFFGEYVFGWKSQGCHDEWQDLCTNQRRLVIFAPVEHGKSSQISMVRLLWEIGHNPNIRAALVSNTSGQAQKFLGVVRQTIGFNKRYQQVFPHVRQERRRGRIMGWQDSHIVVEREDLSNKDFTVQAGGLLGAIMGARIDLAILDDVLDFDNTLTPTQRRRTVEWLKNTIISRLTARARLWMIGNAWHDEDVMHWAAKNASFHMVSYDAEDDLWPELEIMPNGEIVGWPKVRLRQRRDEVGLVEYNRSMRNIAMREGSSDDFDLDAIEACIELAETAGMNLVGSYSRNDLAVYCGVDLAAGKRAKSGETVFFVGGVDPRGVKRVLSIQAGRWGLVEILKRFLHVQMFFRPTLFMVENNSLQEWVVDLLRKRPDVLALLAQNIDGTLEGLTDTARHIRVKGFTTGTNKADPELGVRAMAVDFAAHKWRVPRHRQTAEWVKEMMRYTPAEHTGDRLMASWFFTHACGARRSLRLRARSTQV